MNVEFNDKNIYMKNKDIYNIRNPQTSKMIDFLIKKGLVSNEKQGNILLVIIAVFILLISAFVFAKYVFNINFSSNNEKETISELTPESIDDPERADALRKIISEQENNIQNNQ